MMKELDAKRRMAKGMLHRVAVPRLFGPSHLWTSLRGTVRTQVGCQELQPRTNLKPAVLALAATLRLRVRQRPEVCLTSDPWQKDKEVLGSTNGKSSQIRKAMKLLGRHPGEE